MHSDIEYLDEKFFLQVFGKRLPVCFKRGEDVYLFDTDGKKYTDFMSGIAVNCLGYSDDGYKTALKSCIDNLMHTSNYFYIEPQAKLAQALCKATGMEKAFFSNSGAEAVEGAIKLARKYHFSKGQNRNQIITMQNSFHGRTMTTLAATGQEKYHEAFKPLTQTFTYVTPNDITELEATISSDTAAVMIEPIIGEGGIIKITPEYFTAVRSLCDKYGALMIADEIQTGCGRTGEFLASPALGALPDVVILAKSLGNGFPIGAFLARNDAADALKPGDHGSTFGGNHLACTAALYVVKKLTTTGIMNQVAKTGDSFDKKLTKLMKSHSCIKEVRAKGLMVGIVLDETTSARDVMIKLLHMGFVTATAGTNVLRFLPPYTIGKKHINALIIALDTIL
jgi:acetylornithine/N-succinyldiaminopimelate aminotransferase